MMRRGRGRVGSSSVRISWDVDIVRGCSAPVAHLSTPGFGNISPGPESSQELAWVGAFVQRRSQGFGCSGVPAKEKGVLSAFAEAGNCVWKRTYRTLWAVVAHINTGRAQLSGHVLERGVGHCLLVCGGISHPDAAMVC